MIVSSRRQWPSTLDQVCQLLNCKNAMLVVHALYPLEMRMRVTSGIAPAHFDTLGEFGVDLQLMWGGVDCIARLPVYEPLVRSQVVSREVWENSRYFREWVKPQGDFDTAAMHL